jgi:hypothetical protein
MDYNKETKMAIYGALQRLLKKINREYPYLTEEMQPKFVDDFSYPSKFYFKIGLSPEIISEKTDYTEYSPELGDRLLKELMEEK